MNWNILIYILLGTLLVIALVILIAAFIKSGMKDYLLELISKAEELYPKTEDNYKEKRLGYVLENFKGKYKWISWLINAVKFITAFCKKYKIINK